MTPAEQLEARIRSEAAIAARPGQYDRLNAIADELSGVLAGIVADALRDAADDMNRGATTWALLPAVRMLRDRAAALDPTRGDQ